ncbi:MULTISPECIES: DUF6708 domain-containing protein [unclassified Modicisalibacter]|uniref:DUF6708 domain-containing protein n=1 Tax=unclassified Modicisalibacter TaxID=2679913 RepID=UPI001CCD86C7|nr:MULTISPECIES: DUF6708 domain-containing protein [unclassified Modicisalibacter]MBZ9560518.1 hypothetical protein [Modicisalibacter sp. R2A 31.J]MBZ9577353.1 hypothetical protein [Modicisalibacter sp. MOD 31.J]
MRPSAKDYYNLFIKGNWGFSSTTSRLLKIVGKTGFLNKKDKSLEGIKANFNDAVMKVNSSFIEVVDAGNRLRGVPSFFGLMGGVPSAYGLAIIIYYIVKKGSEIPFVAYILFAISLAIILLVCFPLLNSLLRRELFRKTHYPMRFNRRDRKVYVWSQDMGVVTMNWDDIQFYTSEATKSQDRRGMSREEIRGYVRDRNGNMLYHLVFFKYEGLKGMKGVLEIWELVRRYMEEPDGHIQAYQVDQRLLDLDGKRESFIHSLIQATQVMADSRAVQLIFAPMVMWAGTGRLIAKWTCRVPRWPEWVEEKCRVDPNDPYVRNRHTEPPLTAKEILWPLFCFLLGWAEVLVILYFCFRGYV